MHSIICCYATEVEALCVFIHINRESHLIGLFSLVFCTQPENYKSKCVLIKHEVIQFNVAFDLNLPLHLVWKQLQK